ncbi:alpha/beta-hydrolase [Cucurbitaria berberidis CBS 394.84]|uniref:Kynurenine formamidase n=1 Tax=Cucurbitaria berberidis CBS 394.84 TaxID=1168544 RepID=A0A9P4G8B4_9PLEO|nr:alpha/beta-hydrolase [Cucurbitaria berberidis CBS 394.84]KAF1840933.1 alpha/beta-hydrolase [Cucurbitaria berberidis CBS 394.84]
MVSTAYPRHIPSIRYSDSSDFFSRLQTLDVWLPRPLEQSDPANSLWIIYIHGGAWRDPLQDAKCVEPTLNRLFSESNASALRHVAGIASLNYRLSPYASHPTDPSSRFDRDRNVQHPTHVRDIARGIQYLQKEYGVKRWIGVGHSCGATMLLQLVSGLGLEDESSSLTGNTEQRGPEALILLEGIYNIPLLLRNHLPPTCPENISQIYRDFIVGAFGPDQAVYQSVSPVSGKYNTKQWSAGRLIVICHSYEDELVERAQRDVMCVALDREGWSIVMEAGDDEDEVRAEGRRVLNVRDLKGGHDWIWEDGEQIAKLVAEVVQRLT